jgi:hypothetical protein
VCGVSRDAAMRADARCAPREVMDAIAEIAATLVDV